MIKYTTTLFVTFISFICFAGSGTSTQYSNSGNSREYIKEHIRSNRECKNVAITKRNGDLMLYGGNGWAAKGCPEGLVTALHELNEQNVIIKDVQLTENGSWLIIYGGNGLRWSNIPYDLERKIREYNENHEEITSITFNDSGDWIVISEKLYNSSHSNILNWLTEGVKKYGHLRAACLTDDALVAVYDGGYRFFGNVPESLKEALKKTTIDVYYIKIAGDSWFFADKNGKFDYYM